MNHFYWLWPENGTPETNLAKIIGNLTWYFSAFIEGDGDVPDAEPPWIFINQFVSMVLGPVDTDLWFLCYSFSTWSSN